MAGGPRLSKAKAGQAKTSAPVGPMTGCAVSRSEMRPNGSKRRGFAVGDPARRSRDGDGKTSAPVGPMTGRAVSRSEMRPNGSKRRGASVGPAVEQRNVPRQTPREYAGPHLSGAKMG